MPKCKKLSKECSSRISNNKDSLNCSRPWSNSKESETWQSNLTMKSSKLNGLLNRNWNWLSQGPKHPTKSLNKTRRSRKKSIICHESCISVTANTKWRSKSLLWGMSVVFKKSRSPWSTAWISSNEKSSIWKTTSFKSSPSHANSMILMTKSLWRCVKFRRRGMSWRGKWGTTRASRFKLIGWVRSRLWIAKWKSKRGKTTFKFKV